MSQPERRALPVLSVMDMVPVSAGHGRTDALNDMIALARAADVAGYERYWLAEHHGSSTYLSSATIVLMGQVLAATERLSVASGGIMLPNHAPLVVAEQIGTLATLYPGRVDLGLGRAPGTDRRTAAALRRGASDPRRFAEEILEILTYLGDEPAPGPHAVPGSLLLGAAGAPDDAAQDIEPSGPRVRAIPGEGTHPGVWVLGSSVNGARVAGRLGLPFAVASHFAPVQAEAAIATYRSVFGSRSEGTGGTQGAPRVAAAINVMVAPSEDEARLLFSTAMAAAARIVGNRPGPLDPPTADPEAWRAHAPGKEAAVESAMSLSYVGTADDVAARLREQAERWDLDEILVVTHAHDPALRRRSYELLAHAWHA
ncbi:LLM class flavin-dependent oxidoreductase [Actinomyces sp. ZJ308]|uniref:LLM class flavin-dependent oxidoreductase n=1 Tax=Actinomyces sp. ZJ308 TaxID=2708342 RepID=UPI00142124F6|nr:LLM class flavin-dependent oxidoreductase [Actinomyces sp. ZJ308]